MAKKAYIGVGGVAKKIKKGYVGIDGVARKIKKAYIGIGGVARPCWSGGELAYYGAVTGLRDAVHSLVATSFNGYGIFAGGKASTKHSTRVLAYDESLTTTNLPDLSVGVAQAAATARESHVYVAGGLRYGSTSPQNTLNMYDKSFTWSTSTLSDGAYDLAAATVGNISLFAGGQKSSGYTAGVCGFDASGKFQNFSLLSAQKSGHAATTVGNHALFAGGARTSTYYYSDVDTYDSSATKGVATGLSLARKALAATTVGNYALFAGGYAKSSQEQDIVDAYDTSLTRTTPTALSSRRMAIAATTLGNYAIFAGGSDVSSGYSATVDVYDASLTRTTNLNLAIGRERAAGTTVGAYALIGGGLTADLQTATVEAFTVA